MNELRHYVNLVRRAENRPAPVGYTEGHHIFPRCVFGDNDRVVVLTAREHYVAHLLLWKVYKKRYGKCENTRNLGYALLMMGGKDNNINGHIYEELRRTLKGREITWKENLRKPKTITPKLRQEWERRKGTIVSKETRQKLSESSKGRVWWNDGRNHKMSRECPGNGWVRGRININKGRVLSPETRRKISEGNKAARQR
jgi:hypothetical protein